MSKLVKTFFFIRLYTHIKNIKIKKKKYNKFICEIINNYIYSNRFKTNSSLLLNGAVLIDFCTRESKILKHLFLYSFVKRRVGNWI